MAYYIFLHLPESFCVLYCPIFHFQLLYHKIAHGDGCNRLFNCRLKEFRNSVIEFNL